MYQKKHFTRKRDYFSYLKMSELWSFMLCNLPKLYLYFLDNISLESYFSSNISFRWPLIEAILVKWYSANHGLQTHDDYISNSLQPKSITQSQIENPVKCMKILAFCKKSGRVIQNHSLGIHSDKIVADSTTQNTLQLIRPICPIGQNI